MNYDIINKNASEYDSHAQAWQASMDSNFGHKYLEKPAMLKELPESFSGKSVLCIGVGSGDELQEILKRNPAKVVGIDISMELLKIAQSRFPNVEFKKMDMMKMDFEDSIFEFVYSSLALHYAYDWDILCSEINRVLKNSGELLFSTHNPVYWSQKAKTGKSYTNKRGITLIEHTGLFPGNVTATFYNHPNVESILDALRHSGFEVIKHYLPKVIDVPLDSFSIEDKEKYLTMKSKNENNPLFLIVKAQKSKVTK